MLILAAGWLAEVSLAKLIVLLIGAVILVPVIMVMLVGIIVGSIAVIAAGASGLPPWAPPHAWRGVAGERKLVMRPGRGGALTWGLTLLLTGVALAYGLAAGLTESTFAVVTLVLLGMGAGLLISCLIVALRRRPTAGEGEDIRPPDGP